MRVQEVDEVLEYERSIPEGNHNVRQLLDALLGLSPGLLNITYDSKINKFAYARVENEATAGYDVYI